MHAWWREKRGEEEEEKEEDSGIYWQYNICVSEYE